MADVLQEFLSLGLLDIGDDDTRLVKLREAAADLKKLFLDQPLVGLYHALMVYSVNVDSDDQCFTECAESLLKHWPTYKNRYSDVPREIFRAMSLQALVAATQENSALRAAVTYGLRSLSKHPTPNKDGLLLQKIFENLETQLEKDATAAWLVNAPATVAAASKAISITAPQIDKSKLQPLVGSASGPHNEQSQAYPTPNPNWPNSGPPWSYAFVPKMTDAISVGIDSSVKALAVEVSKEFKTFQEQVSSSLAAGEKARDAQRSAQRTELLWWRHSLYSQSLAKGYRQVPSAVAAVSMAFDVHQLVGPITPVSVDFFLQEAVRETLDQDGLSLPELLAKIKSGGHADIFSKLTANLAQRHGVKTVVEKLADDIGAVDQSDHEKKPKGEHAKGEADINFPHFAVKIFLALQSLRLVRGKANERKV